MTWNGSSRSYSNFEDSFLRRISAPTIIIYAVASSGSRGQSVPYNAKDWLRQNDRIQIKMPIGEWTREQYVVALVVLVVSAPLAALS
jgi:hypothetical protein